MNNLTVGDYVRWKVDVDKVYSTYTKTFVGKVGMVLPPQEYYDAPLGGNKYLTRKGFHDVIFWDGEKTFTVGNIPENELVKVDKQ